MPRKKKIKKKTGQIAINRRASYDYTIGDKFEAGLLLISGATLNSKTPDGWNILHENIATAMGNYYFKDKSGKKIKVEYTLVYIKRNRGEIKIVLHHSSLPYNLNQ